MQHDLPANKAQDLSPKFRCSKDTTRINIKNICYMKTLSIIGDKMWCTVATVWGEVFHELCRILDAASSSHLVDSLPPINMNCVSCIVISPSSGTDPYNAQYNRGQCSVKIVRRDIYYN